MSEREDQWTMGRLMERVDQLEQRLGPIDPGGGDRIDELESAIGHLRSTIQVAEARAEQAEQSERRLMKGFQSLRNVLHNRDTGWFETSMSIIQNALTPAQKETP